MTRRKCDEIEALIDREAQGLSEAERLCLEQHLGECASCRGAVAIARLVRDTIREAPYRLPEHGRERAIARAFARTDGIEIHGARKRRALLTVSAGMLVAAAAGFLLMFSLRDTGELASKDVASMPRSGAVQVEAPKESLAAKPEPTYVEASQRERHTFAHASVQLEPETRVRFDPEHTTLALERGRIDVDVDVSKGRPFSVTTQHFRVQVLGTRFSVTPETVVVEHGRVQVFGLDGSVLARDLGAGASFSYGAKLHKPEARTPAVSARIWLARAREALAQGNTKSARELVARAEESDPHRADRAEASTLRAEAALLDRDAKGAIRLYQSVSARYPDLTAGENAAFAAAQLAGRADRGRERALLTHYLERYPRGRFADEAKQRLRKLSDR